ncbi:MAG: diguanylate cyclase [Nitrospirae bacterium]|nr:diguanylate cyclase [Nitrospirota bacterium]
MNSLNEITIYKRFVISISLIVVLSFVAIFTAATLTNRTLIYEQAGAEARALFTSIVMARKWNSHYGGVYVEKTPGMQSNPYLVNPDLTTTDGRVFTKKNPALMTREISELADKEGLFSFHITSLKPLNPENRADAFEQEALKGFSQGITEYFRDEQKPGKTLFRYMAPLYVESSCLECHAQEGYKVGEVRGGISVTFDISTLHRLRKLNTLITLSLGAASTALLLALVFVFTNRLMKQIAQARQKIETMAIIDELTSLFNRRHVLTRFKEELERAQRLKKDIACMMIDIDHFKEVNDTYGHMIGDKILKEAAALIMDSIRTYDIAGRYGGEEFLVVLPDTAAEHALSLAERLRINVEENLCLRAGIVVKKPITVSLGIASLRSTDKTVDDLLMRSDDSLYKAKREGRNRVACIIIDD